MSIYCKFYDSNQVFLSEVECSNSWANIPQGAVCGLFYDNAYKITELELQFDTVTLTFNSQVTDHFLVVFPVSQTSFLASDVRSSQFMSDVPQLSQPEIDYLKSLASGSIDFSTIVTALNSIASALSVLTNLTNLSNLSNLADLANIITAIQNKDNQSDLVNELRFIFTTNQSRNTYRYLDGFNNFSVFKSANSGNDITSSSTANRVGIRSVLQNISNKLSFVNDSVANANSTENVNKSFFEIFDVLQNIETKLDQNLPFTTIVNNDYIDNCVSASVAYNRKIENIPFN